jgi:hypothetical protein
MGQLVVQRGKDSFDPQLLDAKETEVDRTLRGNKIGRKVIASADRVLTRLLEGAVTPVCDWV